MYGVGISNSRLFSKFVSRRTQTVLVVNDSSTMKRRLALSASLIVFGIHPLSLSTTCTQASAFLVHSVSHHSHLPFTNSVNNKQLHVVLSLTPYSVEQLSESMDSSPTDADATGANTAANGNVSVVNGDLRSSCYHIRSKVFIEEQGVPADIERDSEDEGAIHVLAVDMHQQPCGAARLLIDDHDNDNLADGRQEGKEKTRVGKIGRVSVLQEYRGKGFGRKISQFSVDHLRSLGCSKAKLGAQTHAIPFYESLGFVVVEDGDEYMDAGMPHRDMEQIL